MVSRRYGNLFCCSWQVPIQNTRDQCTIGIASAGYGFVLALVKVKKDGLVQPLRLWDEASMGNACVLVPKGSALSACGWELHCAGAVVVSNQRVANAEPGPTNQRIVLCFGVVVFVAVSNWHRRAYVMACDCRH